MTTFWEDIEDIAAALDSSGRASVPIKTYAKEGKIEMAVSNGCLGFRRKGNSEPPRYFFNRHPLEIIDK